MAARDQRRKLFDDPLGEGDVRCDPGQRHGVAAHVDVGVEELFQHPQIGVRRSQKPEHGVRRKFDAGPHGPCCGALRHSAG